MKCPTWLMILPLALGTAGCSLSGASAGAARTSATVSSAIVTPDSSLTATVVAVNPVGRFVVLGFNSGPLPKDDKTLFIYHAGLKVAEVKITGPRKDVNVVADLVAGDAEVGDTVRAE
jgi:hypothetical protein